MKKMKTLNLKLNSLVIFRNILNDEVVEKLRDLLSSYEDDLLMKVNKYSSFVSTLFEKNHNLSNYLLNLILEDENIYVKKIGQKLHIESYIEDSLKQELKVLEEISKLSSVDIIKNIDYEGYLSSWETQNIDFTDMYFKRINNISKWGYGIYSKYHTFKAIDGKVVPVNNPDKITLDDLKGYKKERSLVIKNTEALLDNKPAANVLLYGDAGTGKSSTVKALVNEYREEGLRLVEISKNQIKDISLIMDTLGKNPLKFILFIDDLSFTKNDNEFGELKAILEGSIYSKPSNISIYATSNRRHMVKEKFSDRDGDDMHLSETIEEIASLSDRFGLMVSFYRPDKKDFLNIVKELALQYNVDLYGDKLEREAEKFAVRRSGRSPRIARQFIEYLLTKE